MVALLVAQDDIDGLLVLRQYWCSDREVLVWVGTHGTYGFQKKLAGDLSIAKVNPRQIELGFITGCFGRHNILPVPIAAARALAHYLSGLFLQLPARSGY
jgi:hypothetical protein